MAHDERVTDDHVVEQFGLNGRRILVTGANGTIGVALATALREAGAALVVTGRSPTIGELGDRLGAHAIAADLRERSELLRVYGETREVLGGLDGLVLVHGIVRPGPAIATTEADWDATIEANLLVGLRPLSARRCGLRRPGAREDRDDRVDVELLRRLPGSGVRRVEGRRWPS